MFCIIWNKDGEAKKKIFFFFLGGGGGGGGGGSNWEFFVWNWEKNILFGIGMGLNFGPKIGWSRALYPDGCISGILSGSSLFAKIPVLQYYTDCSISHLSHCLFLQDAILTTMDIVFEGFGFMLSFGDLAWVPFLYTLQGRYVLEHPITMPWYCLAGIVVLNCKYFLYSHKINWFMSRLDDFTQQKNLFFSWWIQEPELN